MMPEESALDKLKENGCEAMIYMADHLEGEEYFKKVADCGVKYVCCCSAGYDHFNIEAMKAHGLKGANVPKYSPNAISEHTVMLVLAGLRKFRTQILNVENGNYQVKSLMGREIRNMVIGVVGAGRIGCVTMQCLSGFGPKKIYACDPYENDEVKKYAEYATIDEIYERCDVIIFHTVLNETNYHMINDESIAKMKDGVVLVNSSRGGLFDTDAILRAVESGKIGALCIDVIEDEWKLRKKERFEECPIPVLGKLLEHDNVIYTPHAAFFTDEAERNLTQGTVDNLVSYMESGTCANELVQK
jgi:D-lactate dehydrogenase